MIAELKELVRVQRKARWLSQAELARLAGVGKTVVFDLEHGKETVQLDTVTKIVKALDIQVVFRTLTATGHPELPVSEPELPATLHTEPEDEAVPVHLL